MKQAVGRLADIFNKAQDEMNTKVEVFLCNLDEMPRYPGYAFYERDSDAIYVWTKLDGILSDEELKALAFHELTHVRRSRSHGHLERIHKGLRPLLWWGWRKAQTCRMKSEDKREEEAEVATIKEVL